MFKLWLRYIQIFFYFFFASRRIIYWSTSVQCQITSTHALDRTKNIWKTCMVFVIKIVLVFWALRASDRNVLGITELMPPYGKVQSRATYRYKLAVSSLFDACTHKQLEIGKVCTKGGGSQCQWFDTLIIHYLKSSYFKWQKCEMFYTSYFLDTMSLIWHFNYILFEIVQL